MDIFSNVVAGLQIVLQPVNLLYCFIGVSIGTLIGVLPGIGPTGAVAILLPSTFGVSPVAGIIMLSGIYYGAMYGGSTTSILVNIPGEAASVVTTLDGYQMARKGRAGPALGMACMGSFIGGTLSIIMLMFLVNPLADVALKFGPPEFFSIMVAGLSLVTYLARGSVLKAVIMALVGLFLGLIGTDLISGRFRFTLGMSELSDGVGLVPIVMGLFGISEVLTNIEKAVSKLEIFETKIEHLFPTLNDWKRSIGAILRGTLVGFGLGILPGGGAVISSFASYATEKRFSKHPEEFGSGAIEGVAGPETANNAASVGNFVPLLAFGIPPNAIMALFLGALLMHGVIPGPMLVSQHPHIFWGLIVSMYLGNVMLVALNLPAIPLWVKFLKVPYHVLFPLILLFCLIGAYSINNSIFDVQVMLVFGLVGYILRKFKYEEAPLVLAFVLGPMLERAFRQSLIMSNGSLSIFFTRPFPAIALGISIVAFISTQFTFFRNVREKIT